MLISELKKLKLEQELISVRRSCADEDQTGIIEFVNDEITIFCMYTDDGEYDGYTLFYTEQIYEVLWGNREHEAISTLIQKYGKKSSIEFDGESFEDIFKSLSVNYSSLCIYTDDESQFDIAVVESQDDDWLKIKTFGPKKTLSSLYKLIKNSDVGRIDIDSPYQNKIVELHVK
ncbi:MULTISPECIES: hypothetical protein [unclassified Colwellia]|uniref:hypothetical protein n=1 Tax=unclassified Colwellia TaxID=196834 RepID=UPI0015F55B1C|nr:MULTISPECIES: hypothetical protein [unclassified Colwellia]MBA6231451.1 hypothetical protein [Colwellia sp. MB02u-7]MBA6235620.1 hypothetical protein [Colwellia sp. MB02u-11]MBA6297895.1 hypothetical protein [Colwellia sp. MB3u-22]MBA6309664.1 hypothetical protein [Colwellia sp. MB3u-64]